ALRNRRRRIDLRGRRSERQSPHLLRGCRLQAVALRLLGRIHRARQGDRRHCGRRALRRRRSNAQPRAQMDCVLPLLARPGDRRRHVSARCGLSVVQVRRRESRVFERQVRRARRLQREQRRCEVDVLVLRESAGGRVLLGAAAANVVCMADEQLDAYSSDPATLGWMVGSPPPPDKLLRYEDGSFLKFPQRRWTFSHWREFWPTITVSGGAGPTRAFEVSPRTDLDDATFMPINGTKPMTWAESLTANFTDGIVVLHRGAIVYERYFGV